MGAVRGKFGRRPGKYVVLAIAVVVLIAASVAWWQWPVDEEEKLALPSRVCRGTFSGSVFKPFFEEDEGKLRTKVDREFPEYPAEFPVCELSGDTSRVSFRIEELLAARESRKEMKASNRQVAELGPAYGATWQYGGTIGLYIPCPSSENSRAHIYVNVGSSAAKMRETNVKAANKGMRKLAHLTGYTARTLAHRYKCEGADELPDGPVQLRAGDGKL